MKQSVTAKAPCSTANLGPGFDVFGLALDAYYDEIKLIKEGKKIIIESSDSIPLDTENNSAGLVVKEMSKKFRIKTGIKVIIKKGVPAGFGMGSSAASAAGAAVAFNTLFNLNLKPDTLVQFAGMGERASAGSIHYDNVAASVIGGFVIVRTEPFQVVRIEPPRDLVLCIAIPQISVPKKKTKVSRSVLPSQIELSDHVKNIANAAALTAGFMKKDVSLICNSIRDVIVEPAREHFIPGFAKVRSRAIRAGALGFTISGAGPSVIAFTSLSSNHKKICESMEKGFALTGTKCKTIICKPSSGAFIV